MVLVNPIIPSEMLTQNTKPNLQYNQPKESNTGFKNILYDNMRNLGSIDPEKDFSDYQKHKRETLH